MIIQVKKKHVNPENIRNYVLFVLVEHRGFEPLTSTLPVWRAPSCANAPLFYCAKPILLYFGRKSNKKFAVANRFLPQRQKCVNFLNKFMCVLFLLPCCVTMLNCSNIHIYKFNCKVCTEVQNEIITCCSLL